MNRIAVISANNNPDYFFYVPIVEWVWDKFGWQVALFKTPDCGDLGVRLDETIEHFIPLIDDVRPGTCAQTVRHFVSNVLPKESYIMVQDIDLIPLQRWEPDMTKKTIYGWELTGKSFIPVHYTGMLGRYWYEIMECTGDLKADMERAMKENGRAYGKDWDQYWDTDWDILTQKFKKYGLHNFTFIERGLIQLAQDATPVGRLDRYDLDATMKQPNLIDFHASNHNPSAPEKVYFLKMILERTFGELPTWLDEHVEQHHAKYGQGR